MADSQDILYEVREGVAIVTLNRPGRLNALSPQMSDALPRVLGDAEADPEVRCVLITGAGRYFCSGWDLVEDEAPAFMFNHGPLAGFGRIAIAIRHMAKPSVAALNGGAAGGGLGLALACDFRIAADDARFTTAFMRRSIQPDSGVTYFLPRLVGIDRALELLFFAETFGAADALEMRMVTHVVPAADLAERAFEYARRVAKGPIAIETTRKAVYANQHNDLAQASDLEEFLARIVADSDDLKEGIAAFLEKREPRFTGR